MNDLLNLNDQQWRRMIYELRAEVESLSADLATAHVVTVMQAERSVKQRKEIQDLHDEIARLKAEIEDLKDRLESAGEMIMGEDV